MEGAAQMRAEIMAATSGQSGAARCRLEANKAVTVPAGKGAHEGELWTATLVLQPRDSNCAVGFVSESAAAAEREDQQMLNLLQQCSICALRAAPTSALVQQDRNGHLQLASIPLPWFGLDLLQQLPPASPYRLLVTRERYRPQLTKLLRLLDDCSCLAQPDRKAAALVWGDILGNMAAGLNGGADGLQFMVSNSGALSMLVRAICSHCSDLQKEELITLLLPRLTSCADGPHLWRPDCQEGAAMQQLTIHLWHEAPTPCRQQLFAKCSRHAQGVLRPLLEDSFMWQTKRARAAQHAEAPAPKPALIPVGQGGTAAAIAPASAGYNHRSSAASLSRWAAAPPPAPTPLPATQRPAASPVPAPAATGPTRKSLGVTDGPAAGNAARRSTSAGWQDASSRSPPPLPQAYHNEYIAALAKEQQYYQPLPTTVRDSDAAECGHDARRRPSTKKRFSRHNTTSYSQFDAAGEHGASGDRRGRLAVLQDWFNDTVRSFLKL